jgi:hypothetical protein
MTAITYDPDIDNCRGGCRRNDNRRVFFGWYGPNFACPGCFEATFGPLDEEDNERIITLTPEQVEAGRL